MTDTLFDARRPRALDLFCGAGGASTGLTRAGFEVIGVDLANQPRYPFTFIRSDVFALFNSGWLKLGLCDFIWASPPCQHYSDLAARNGNASDHPDLVGRTRELLEATGLPYVIENVEGAPLVDPVVVCGTERGLGVDGYRLRRHRLFEANWPLHVASPSASGCRCGGDPRPIIDVSGGGPTHAPRLDGGGGRTYKGTVAQKRAAMGIDWMTGAELVEAIPPAYGQFIGEQAMAYLERQWEVAA